MTEPTDVTPPASPDPVLPAAAAGEDQAVAAAPVASPFSGLRTNAGSVLVGAFDLLTRAAGDVRRGSFYIGLIVLGTVGPIVVLSWGLEVAVQGEDGGSLFDALRGPAAAWLLIAEWLAIAGVLVAFVESRGVATALLGARLEGRPFRVRDAVQRSRAVFWQVLIGMALVNVPALIAQQLLGSALASAFPDASELTGLIPAIVVSILVSPFAYVVSGIVLGDVGPVESARRSVRLFSARRGSAVVVSLFALAAQFLTLIGAGAGLDLIARVFDSLALGPASGDVGVAIVTIVILAVVFAIGSLLFTVAAIAAAPEVVMFLALTHATPGLAQPVTEPAGDPAAAPASRTWLRTIRGGRFRWLTLPMSAAIAVGLVTTVAGLVVLNR